MKCLECKDEIDKGDEQYLKIDPPYYIWNGKFFIKAHKPYEVPLHPHCYRKVTRPTLMAAIKRYKDKIKNR